ARDQRSQQLLALGAGSVHRRGDAGAGAVGGRGARALRSGGSREPDHLPVLHARADQVVRLHFPQASPAARRDVAAAEALHLTWARRPPCTRIRLHTGWRWGLWSRSSAPAALSSGSHMKASGAIRGSIPTRSSSLWRSGLVIRLPTWVPAAVI